MMKYDGIVTGIYEIKNNVTGCVYIGKSRDISDRWNQHKTLLKRNKHTNRHLQDDWNCYGDKSFSFSIVEQLPHSVKDSWVDVWLETAELKLVLQTQSLYNIKPVVLLRKGAERKKELIARFDNMLARLVVGKDPYLKQSGKRHPRVKNLQTASNKQDTYKQ